MINHYGLIDASGIAANGWRYVFGLPCMAYRVTNTACGKLKYTACYQLGGNFSRKLNLKH